MGTEPTQETTPEEDKSIREESLGTFTEEDNSWVYDLRYPLEPYVGKKDPYEGVERIRMEKRVYGRHIRDSGGGAHQGEVVFLLVCSLTGKSPDLISRLDAEDYGNLANKAQSILTKKR